MVKKKDPIQEFDSALAKALANAIKAGKFKPEGLDKVLFMAGQLSAPRIRAK